MKKLGALLLAVIMIISFTACGKKEEFEGMEGTWKVDSIEYEGSKFSVEEWKNIEYEDFGGFYIIFKDGGKAYIYDDYGDLVNWVKLEDGVMIGDKKCSIVDGMICLDYYGDKIYLKKASDSQEIPKEDEPEDEDVTDEDDSSVNETTVSTTGKVTTTGDDTKWKQFLKDYEAWVDDYIALIEKYKNNPADMSIVSDYTEMVSEMADWSKRADELELELEDTDAAIEYSAELLRIAGKLAQAAY